MVSVRNSSHAVLSNDAFIVQNISSSICNLIRSRLVQPHDAEIP